MSDTSSIRVKGRTYRCTICSNSFKTSSHLRRHENSHSREPSSHCQFCGRGFLRHDALRRHFKSCSEKGEGELVPSPKLGRRRHACNHCYTRKIRCDGKQPCARCSISQAKCSYMRDPLETALDPTTLDPTAIDQIAFDQSALRQTSNDEVSHPIEDDCVDQSPLSLPFLRSYTDPRFESITYAFAASGALVETVFNEEEPPYNTVTESAPNSTAITSEGDSTYRSDGTILQARVEEMIQTLASQHRTSPQSTQFPLDIARQVFTPHTLLRYISAYFQYFHPQFSFIHQPTFSIQHASLPLLLAIALAGSAHSPPTDDALSAPSLYSVAEDFIFRCLHDVVTASAEIDDLAIQTAQAAVLINALLYSSTDQSIARRGLFHRFPVLLASVRSMGLVKSRRSMPLQNMSWERFISEESRIRTAAAVFFSGGISTISFNNAVQLPVSEMVGDLPCADALFEAPSPDVFAKLLVASTCVTGTGLSLKEWMALYLQDSWPEYEDARLTSIEPKLLTIHIVALHSIIYAARTNFLATSSYSTLLRATNRWKELYDVVYGRNDVSDSQLVGFVKYSIELWWLARKLLEFAHTGKEENRYLAGTPTDSRHDLQDFIQKYGPKS